MIESSVASLLCKKIGIDFQVSSPRVLARVLRKRMEAVGISDDDAYFAYVSSNYDELRQIVELLVVPETWFFRDWEPFAYLRETVTTEDRFRWCRPLRILSLPASTGEEPYSIAMILLDAGLSPSDFQVDAVDISGKALDRAVAGVYGPSSFREKNVEFSRKYFEKRGSLSSVVPEVRGTVRFLQGNVLRWAAVTAQGTYDVIFFRNLLVYLNEEARQQAVRAIDRMLGEGGILILGFAEPHHIFFPHYIQANHPRSYAAHKPKALSERNVVPGTPPPLLSGGTTNALKRLPRVESKAANLNGVGRLSPRVPAVKPPDPATLEKYENKAERPERGNETIERARELADKGLLVEAARICRKRIESDPACAETHYLLGVISLADKDEDQAMDHFGKVIYLEPDHADALVHLSLLAEKMGLEGQAERYRKRLERLGSRSTT